TGVTADQVVSAADIVAGRLKFVAPDLAGVDQQDGIGFRVGDADGEFSAAAYTLSVDMTNTPVGTTAVADTDVGTAAAGAWTAVYGAGDNAVSGFGGETVRV